MRTGQKTLAVFLSLLILYGAAPPRAVAGTVTSTNMGLHMTVEIDQDQYPGETLASLIQNYGSLHNITETLTVTCASTSKEAVIYASDLDFLVQEMTYLEAIDFSGAGVVIETAASGKKEWPDHFAGTELTQIALPTNVEVIADGAFKNCTALTDVNLEALTSLEVIGASAFENTGLTEIELGTTGPLRIGSRAFVDSALTALRLPNLTTAADLDGTDAFPDASQARQPVSVFVSAAAYGDFLGDLTWLLASGNGQVAVASADAPVITGVSPVDTDNSAGGIGGVLAVGIEHPKTVYGMSLDVYEYSIRSYDALLGDWSPWSGWTAAVLQTPSAFPGADVEFEIPGLGNYIEYEVMVRVKDNTHTAYSLESEAAGGMPQLDFAETPVFEYPATAIDDANYTILFGAIPVVTAWTVSAAVTDGGTVTYEWYETESAAGPPDVTQDTLVAIGSAYTPNVSSAGTRHYYAAVKNTQSGARLVQEEYAYTQIVTVSVLDGDAEVPVIESDPESAEYITGDPADPLAVEAAVNSGSLRFQWYENSTDDNTGGSAIPGETDPDEFTPDTDTAGVTYYYVVVTNEDPTKPGAQVAEAASDTARIKVDDPLPEMPVIQSSSIKSASYLLNTAAETWVVEASAPDGGTISYQWYVIDFDLGTNPIPIDGETGNSFTPDTSSEGTRYYFVIVSNANPSGVTADWTSSMATVTVSSALRAQTPEITEQPRSAEYFMGDSPAALHVAASVSDGGTLSYQWYAGTRADGTDAVAISGATGSVHVPDTNTAGTAYYYVEVTNTIYGLTETAVSDTATVTVREPVDAAAPVIVTHPQSARYTAGGTAKALTVEAVRTDSGDVFTYQWYVSDHADGSNAAAIENAVGASYVPDVGTVGTRYYFVVVTNTNTGVTGIPTAETVSEIATIAVTAGGTAEHTVTFMVDGAQYLSVTVPDGETVEAPADPEKEGCSFTGWYTDAACKHAYNFDSVVTGDFNLYAGWLEEAWHAPYVSGYDDGIFRPNAWMTRVEAAQMFYNLLESPGSGSGKRFSDVATDAWYFDAVSELSGMGVIKGYEDGRFDPNALITRAEFASMVRIFFDLPDGTTVAFADVAADHWAWSAIAAVSAAGIVEGYPDGTYGVGDNINRAQAVTTLNKAQGREADAAVFAGIAIPFSDVTTAHWGWTQIMEAAVGHAHLADYS